MLFWEGMGCICFLCNYFKEHVYILKEEGGEEISNAEHFSIWLCNLDSHDASEIEFTNKFV